MNFIRKHKYALAIIPAIMLAKVAYDFEQQQIKNIKYLTIEDINKDIEFFSDGEKQLINNCLIYQISRPFPGRGFFTWKRTKNIRYYLHNHHKIIYFYRESKE